MTAEESGIRRAFVAALILTENAVAAEAAVMDAIATSGCEIYELLVATAKCAIQMRHHCSPRPKIFFSLRRDEVDDALCQALTDVPV
jgi:hypothetical protein